MTDSGQLTSVSPLLQVADLARSLDFYVGRLGFVPTFEEIVQQTFFRLHGGRNDFRRGSKLRPWVMTIAMNLVREHWRRKKRRKMTSLEVETQAAPEAEFMPLEIRERSMLLHAALEKLPTSQREVVELHWFQERPYAEVATIVGTSEGAVRVRAHRAYATLKQLLVSEIRGDE